MSVDEHLKGVGIGHLLLKDCSQLALLQATSVSHALAPLHTQPWVMWLGVRDGSVHLLHAQ